MQYNPWQDNFLIVWEYIEKQCKKIDGVTNLKQKKNLIAIIKKRVCAIYAENHASYL